MNCKPGDLAVIVRAQYPENLGLFVTVVRPHPRQKHGWMVEGSGPGDWCLDEDLRPIRDNPGNEQFVIEARKTLPRPTPVTGPVTINERGEPA
jgi:hypothetical protein